MPSIKLDTAAHGDILDADVVVNDVVLFDAGTLLTTQRLDILKSLKVRSISIVERGERRAVSIETIHENIDRRFSFVDSLPIMAEIKEHVKEVLANLENQS